MVFQDFFRTKSFWQSSTSKMMGGGKAGILDEGRKAHALKPAQAPDI